MLQDGSAQVVSIRTALRDAGAISGLSLDEPLQTVGLFRGLLLPLYLDIAGVPRSDAEWEQRWSAGRLGREQIDSYLEEHRRRFDLFDAEVPFGQIAGLASVSGEVKPASVLHAAAPAGNNVALFATATDADPKRLTPAEAARALLAVQAFDTAAIKTGAAGDPAVRGGKTTGNPPGVVATLGFLAPVGRTLYETLLLSTRVSSSGLRPGDRPAWRADPPGPSWTTRPARGVLDLLTFQSRRIRLLAEQSEDGPVVPHVILTAGDRLAVLPPDLEPHTLWRRVTDPAPGEPPWRPMLHAPGRALWRTMSSLLAIGDIEQADGRASGALLQIGNLVAEQRLPVDLSWRVLAVGCHLGNQNAIVDDVSVEVLPLPAAALLADGDVREVLLRIIGQAEQLRRAGNRFDDALREAAGGDRLPWDKGSRLGDQLMHEIGALVRRLMGGLQREPDRTEQAEQAWTSAALSVALAPVHAALAASPPNAFAGRGNARPPAVSAWFYRRDVEVALRLRPEPVRSTRRSA